jgi:hypothetical protein
VELANGVKEKFFAMNFIETEEVLQTQQPEKSGVLEQKPNVENEEHRQTSNELSSLCSHDSMINDRVVSLLSQLEGIEGEQRGKLSGMKYRHCTCTLQLPF